jgi:hypothetical protein
MNRQRRWLWLVVVGLSALAWSAPPAIADGRSDMAAFETWYEAHPRAFDTASTKLKAIMAKYGGRDTSAAARMRMKEIEGDRERAAQEWYDDAKVDAEAKLQAGDVAGSIKIMGDVPADFRLTSSGARGKMWARNCAQWAQQQLPKRARSVQRAIDGGELDRAQRELDAIRRIADGLRTGLPADLQAIVPQYDLLHGAASKKLNVILEARRLRARVQPDLDAAASAKKASNWQAMFDAAVKIRAAIGPPAEGETGLRRDAETLWIASATKLATWPAEYEGRGEVTPAGNRVVYNFSSPAQLGDWEVTPTGSRVADGVLQLDKNAVLWHRARWPVKVRATMDADPGAVLQLLFGNHYRVTVAVGFRVIVRRGKDNLADEKVTLPRGTKGPIAIEVVRAGGAFTVKWAGLTIVEVADPAPPIDNELSRIAVHGAWAGAKLPNLTLWGKPTFEIPAPVVTEDESDADEPVEELPKGWQKLRHPINGLKGWGERNGGKWSTRGATELMHDGGRKRARIATFTHNDASARKFTEYEFAVEMRFVKHRNGCAPGLLFRVNGETVAWIFDDANPAELVGLQGGGSRGVARGTQQNGTTAWQAVRGKVKLGISTHTVGGLSETDFIWAARVQALY